MIEQAQNIAASAAMLHETEHGDFLPLLPLKNVVTLPKSIQPILVGRAMSIKAVEYALKHNIPLFITAQKDPKTDNPTMDDLYEYGTRATILQVARMPNNGLKILAEGLCRSRIAAFKEHEDGFIQVITQDVPSEGLDKEVPLEAAWRQLKSLYHEYTKLNEKAPTELTAMVKTASDMDDATDTIAVHISNLSFESRQLILETPQLRDRMIKIAGFLKKEIEILNTEQKIRGRIQTQVEKSQREYYLTEQMKAIQKELGRDDQSADIEQMRSKAKKLGLPAEVMSKVEKELDRLELMPPLSSEAVVSRHYLDWIMGLPWKKQSKDSVSMLQAKNLLDKHHAGLKKAKERILEFIAAKKFSKNMERAPIICLVGPPGVGKTSLAQSIADSIGREFVRISLGGIRDEAEIRGHRRTYIGALPGKIIQAMKKAETINPVILLDEIDKMSQDVHGDPAAALLEVLDPEQNKTFHDHFLDVGYDLSHVMFIATANVLENIPYPLLDRLEIISLSGYTDDEKMAIAQKFLIPKNLKEYSLDKQQFKLSSELIQYLVSEYTKEAGVRQLDRIVAKLMRKVIQVLLESKQKSVTLTKELIIEWLGNPTIKKTTLNEKNERIGLATGLAWTEVGGDILEIETTALPGKGNVQLTGQLGEVMQESAHAGMSYIRSRAKDFGLASSFHANKDIHIHMPEGATPKDGPSAGIAICTALISALTDTPTRRDVAMSGEITLQGRVIAVGGLKEKLLAAKQHRMSTVIVPEENRDDIEEIQKETKLDGLSIVFAKHLSDVVLHAFTRKPVRKISMTRRKDASRTKKNKAA